MTKKDDKPTFEYPEDFFDDGIPKGVLSISGFGTMRRCAKQFEYAYVDGLRNPPGVAMTKGKAVHKGAEVVHRYTIDHGELMQLEEALQKVSDKFDDDKVEIEDWEDLKEGTVKDAALANFRVYYKQAVPLIRPVAAEKTFAQKFGTVPMRGVIDLIDKVPGDYSLEDDPEQPPPLVEVVSDLKVTGKSWSEQRIQNDPQLTAYSIVEGTERVRADILLDQKKGTFYKPMRALRDVNIKKRLIEDLESVVYQIKKGLFPRCDPTAWNCSPRWCGYYTRCMGPK